MTVNPEGLHRDATSSYPEPERYIEVQAYTRRRPRRRTAAEKARAKLAKKLEMQGQVSVPKVGRGWSAKLRG